MRSFPASYHTTQSIFFWNYYSRVQTLPLLGDSHFAYHLPLIEERSLFVCLFLMKTETWYSPLKWILCLGIYFTRTILISRKIFSSISQWLENFKTYVLKPQSSSICLSNDFCLQHFVRGKLTSVHYFKLERSLSHIKGGCYCIPINLFPYATANINSSFLLLALFFTI